MLHVKNERERNVKKILRFPVFLSIVRDAILSAMSRENARQRRCNASLNSAPGESVRLSSSSSTPFYSTNDNSTSRKKGKGGGMVDSPRQRTGTKRNNSRTTAITRNVSRFLVSYS